MYVMGHGVGRIVENLDSKSDAVIDNCWFKAFY